jgi:single-strand DNA-binding protein
MAGINKVILVGNVGRDAEVRYTQGGTAVASFSIATSESYTDKTSGQRQEKTEWHNIVCWNRLAEIAGQYVVKGRQLYVEGRLQTRDWVDPQGVKHYKTEIVAQTFQLLGRREDAPGGGGGTGQGSYQPRNNGGNQQGGYGGGQPAGKPQTYDDYDIGDLGPPLDMDDSPLSPGD